MTARLRFAWLVVLASACSSKRATMGLVPIESPRQAESVRLRTVDSRGVGPTMLRQFESLFTDDPVMVFDNRLEVALARNQMSVRSESTGLIEVALLDAWWARSRQYFRPTVFVRARVSCRRRADDVPSEFVFASSDRDLEIVEPSPDAQVISFEAAFIELAEKIASACSGAGSTP